MFNIGDTIKGVKNNNYGITTIAATMLVMATVDNCSDTPLEDFEYENGNIIVKILKHKDSTMQQYVGSVHFVNSEYFELIKATKIAIMKEI